MKNTVIFTLIFLSFFLNAQKKEVNKAHAPKYFPFKLKHDIYEELENKSDKVDKSNFRLPLNLNTPEINLNLIDYLKSLSSLNYGINWFEAGPNDVGGRVKTLAVDRNNSNIVIAAGVTGGIWKTMNGGNSWVLKSNLTNNFNITSIVQHPTILNEWYASSGEYSSSANGIRNNFILGSGVLYKSIDNGETWQNVSEPQSPNNYLYLTSRLTISPTTNTFFVATNGFGIARSTDGGATFSIVLGNSNGTYNIDYYNTNFIDCEIVVNSNGVLLAELSGELSSGAGFYKSTNDGLTWTNITPSTFTSINDNFDIERSVIAFAPSNPNVAYAYTNSILGAGTHSENVHFHKIDVSNGTFTDRSNNLVKITYNAGTDIYRLPSAQSNYDMCIAVKPNNENFVVIAGQSGPFRSFDGFATDAGVYTNFWETNGVFASPASVCSTSFTHNDHHVLFFDPNDPNKLWEGDDGGVYVLNNVSINNMTNFWTNKNNGFNVTQFYDVAIAPIGQGNKVMGATQDNASPMLIWDSNESSSEYTNFVSGGDGVSSDWQTNYIYTNGAGGSSSSVFSTSSIINTPYTFAAVEGIIDSNSLSFSTNFVAVNPNNEDIIFLNTGLNKIYKGTNANSWPTLTRSQIQSNITTFDISLLGNDLSYYGFSKMIYSNSNSDILYFSLSQLWENFPNNEGLSPKIYKLQNASSASIANAIEISSPLFPAKSYVTDMVVNNLDANEFIVILENKNMEAVFHTIDGGLTYQSIRGNLSIGTYAPSFKCAEIVNTPNGKVYLLGTSMGLFSSTRLNGTATIWQNEALDKIGLCTITDIDYRSNDNIIAVSTHGRGIFIGDASNLLSSSSLIINNQFNVSPNPFQKNVTITFSKSYSKGVEILIFDILGKKIKEINKENEIKTDQKMELDLSEITSAGIYLLKVYDSSNHECVKTFKIIKE